MTASSANRGSASARRSRGLSQAPSSARVCPSSACAAASATAAASRPGAPAGRPTRFAKHVTPVPLGVAGMQQHDRRRDVGVGDPRLVGRLAAEAIGPVHHVGGRGVGDGAIPRAWRPQSRVSAGRSGQHGHRVGGLEIAGMAAVPGVEPIDDLGRQLLAGALDQHPPAPEPEGQRLRDPQQRGRGIGGDRAVARGLADGDPDGHQRLAQGAVPVVAGGVDDRHLVVAVDRARAVELEDLADPAHAVLVQLGGPQRAHAAAADHGDALGQQRQDLLVAHRRRLEEQAVDNQDAVAGASADPQQVAESDRRQDRGSRKESLDLRARQTRPHEHEVARHRRISLS